MDIRDSDIDGMLNLLDRQGTAPTGPIPFFLALLYIFGPYRAFSGFEFPDWTLIVIWDLRFEIWDFPCPPPARQPWHLLFDWLNAVPGHPLRWAMVFGQAFGVEGDMGAVIRCRLSV